ncbi:MAG: hypothetical protein Q8S01_12330 [Ignavibacteria bacterium]|nr:hypothetical protein [Ignavibacteria bacterium]
MKSMLLEVKSNGEKIILLDGSEWLINPEDIPSVCTWIPTAELNITKTKSNDLFSYKITNDGIGISVYASRIK